MKLDILAFGAHPDDVELSCAGVLLVEKLNGKKTGVIDLTQGEMGTRGTVDTRQKEAADAAKILQLDARENLSFADGFFLNDKVHQLTVIAAIRKYRPEIILCNATEDRHPDHAKGAALLYDAGFLSGLSKVETTLNGVLQLAWKPKYVFNYIQDRYLHPDFVVDISAVMDAKIEAIKAYSTQFYNPGSLEPQTYISTPDFLESVIFRAKMFGKMIGVQYAEGFTSKKVLGLSGFDAIVQNNT